ncbi:MAG: DUF1887 family protein, partial [Paludibacteraceae bacterium]|nr:DUF1887 family protein [Paludibacteraceae bacterium]
MRKVLLVSLVSDQTLPNVQIIKEFKDVVTDYMFVTTEGMEKKRVKNWILRSADVESKNIHSIEVCEHDKDDVIQKISAFDYASFDELIVNVTGGTKIMSLATYLFFEKMKNAKIYYVKGTNSDYVELYPVSKENELSCHISIEDYLFAYGFEVVKTPSSGIPFKTTRKIFDIFCSGIFENYPEALSFLRSKRSSGLKSKDFDKVKEFLDAIAYEPRKENVLDELEVKYLTGEWFEEYIGERLKLDLGLNENEILIGAEIKKEVSNKEVNSMVDLLGRCDSKDRLPKNEIDIMFIKDGKFHIFECKTSIVDKRTIKKEKKTNAGKTVLDEYNNPMYVEEKKDVNILGETIYKSDALKSKFG